MRGDNVFSHYVFSFLNHWQKTLLMRWYEETQRSELIGEMPLASMSVVLSIIGGSKIKRAVQLGTYAGGSALLFGWCLKQHRGRLFTVDCVARYVEYASKWIEMAELSRSVTCDFRDSRDPETVRSAVEAMGGAPEVVIIDASHQEEQTAIEVPLWFDALCDQGFLILHDSSEHAIQYDRSGGRGVHHVVTPLLSGQRAIGINHDGRSDVFKDPCGLTIIQKA